MTEQIQRFDTRWNETFWLYIDGTFIDEAEIILKVGEHPKIKCNVCMNVALQKLDDERLSKLRELIDTEIVARLTPKIGDLFKVSGHD